MFNVLIVGAGGAIGSMLRYLLMKIPLSTTFPMITLFINMVGSFILGVFLSMLFHYELSNRWLLFVQVGVCGGFTTFSTFSAEALNLFQSGRPVTAIIYMAISFLLCIVSVYLGKVIMASVL